MKLSTTVIFSHPNLKSNMTLTWFMTFNDLNKNKDKALKKKKNHSTLSSCGLWEDIVYLPVWILSRMFNLSMISLTIQIMEIISTASHLPPSADEE